ncbi:hypothetical protein QWZ13_06550 [Reinekea marina]|nr:hypothetical protein [Reinekea marina]MDN3648569.1 hypothetical protein [Reinekea marina]
MYYFGALISVLSAKAVRNSRYTLVLSLVCWLAYFLRFSLAIKK